MTWDNLALDFRGSQRSIYALATRTSQTRSRVRRHIIVNARFSLHRGITCCLVSEAREIKHGYPCRSATAWRWNQEHFCEVRGLDVDQQTWFHISELQEAQSLLHLHVGRVEENRHRDASPLAARSDSEPLKALQ